MYVGQTWRSVSQRFKSHLSKNSSCVALRNAIAKHGCENFVVSTICELQTQEEMDLAETYFISFFQSLAPSGYNLLAEGRGGFPCIETRAKLSKLWFSRKRGSMPQAQRDKISKAKLGSIPSNKGCKLTDETIREKLRESHRGKKTSPEVRLKMSLSKLGKKKSVETRARMSAARRRRGRSSNET